VPRTRRIAAVALVVFLFAVGLLWWSGIERRGG